MGAFKSAKLIYLVIILLIYGCGDESMPQDCAGDNAQFVETFYSEEFAAIPCGLQNIDRDEKEVNIVISTQTDFEKYIACAAQLPTIDFDNYFILAGTYRHNQCAVYDSQIISVCGSKIDYRVTLLEQDCQAVTSVFYGTVIEKEYNGLTVDFDVQFKN